MNYESCLNYLKNIRSEASPDFTLENVRRLLYLLNEPHLQFPCVHITGTNGKGSVTFKMQKALSSSGYKVGRFISPHVEDLRERITLDGEMISEQSFAYYFTQAYNVVLEYQLNTSYFELVFVTACLFFSNEKVDCACIEVGLGGRLDATNVLRPLLCVITNVSLDHEAILGSSIDAIALEKAGIIKCQTPVVCGSFLPFSLLKQKAHELEAPIKCIALEGRDFNEDNSHLAFEALKQLKRFLPKLKFTQESLKLFCLDYRATVAKVSGSVFESIVFDGAHNLAGMQSILNWVEKHYVDHAIYFLGTFSQNKAVESMLKLLDERCQKVILLEASHSRLLPAEKLKSDPFYTKYPLLDLNALSLEAVEEHAMRDQKNVLLVSGSLFVLSEIKRRLTFSSAHALS